MQFESILWETHVPDKYAIAHLRLSIRISEQEEVIAVDTEAFFRQLGAPLTSFFDSQCRHCLSSMP